ATRGRALPSTGARAANRRAASAGRRYRAGPRQGTAGDALGEAKARVREAEQSASYTDLEAGRLKQLRDARLIAEREYARGIRTRGRTARRSRSWSRPPSGWRRSSR